MMSLGDKKYQQSLEASQPKNRLLISRLYGTTCARDTPEIQRIFWAYFSLVALITHANSDFLYAMHPTTLVYWICLEFDTSSQFSKPPTPLISLPEGFAKPPTCLNFFVARCSKCFFILYGAFTACKLHVLRSVCFEIRPAR